MPLDSDVVLLGTGAAPLVAASQLLSAGKSVLLLNPDFDFFLEDSELPLDPLLPGVGGRFDRDRFFSNTPERVVEVLRPHFPGAVEFKAGGGKSGFHDTQAPHVRARGRLWVAPAGKPEAWDAFENLYLEASEGDFKPQILEGAQASHRFPGCQSNEGAYRGLYIPKMCDVDVSRYRNGLLEFVRERLGPERVVCDAVQIEIMPGVVRFYSGGQARTARAKNGILVFWTPKLTAWILAQTRKTEATPVIPTGIRFWEEWTLSSGPPIDPSIIGVFASVGGDLAVWGQLEGELPTGTSPTRAVPLVALRPGPIVGIDSIYAPSAGMSWASEDSFRSLFDLCGSFLKWDRVTVSAMKARAIFEWPLEKRARIWNLTNADPSVYVVPYCDGPLSQIVQSARESCALIEVGEPT